MAPLREFLYPFPLHDIEKELMDSGIRRLLSYGKSSLGKVKVLGKGKNGVVALTEDLNAIKIRRADSPKRCMKFEARMQERAMGVAPRVIDYGCNYIIMEYVEGRELTRNEDVSVVLRVLHKGFLLDSLQVQHRELTRPWGNIIITRSNAFIVDFEDARILSSPNNFVRLFTALIKSNPSILALPKDKYIW